MSASMSRVASAARALGRAGVCALILGLSSSASAGASGQATSITSAEGHTCATLASGQVDCWGRDYISNTVNHAPVPVAGIAGASGVGGGHHYDCALLVSHALKCWGDNGFGQLGDGSTVDSGTPVAVAGITTAVSVSVGAAHACAVLAGGSVACWGRNLGGALGNGSQHDSAVPVAVRGISNALQVSASDFYPETCALLASGEARCWGMNTTGQLGNGKTTNSSVPVRVAGVSGALGVATGGEHSCALLASGSVVCWGSNTSGQLGNGTLHSSRVAVRVVGLPAARAVAVDGHGYSCALAQAGQVYCWGHNPKNQLGDGLYPVASAVPVQALGVSGAGAISTGQGHACVLLSSGGADCWGYNDYGQLGIGNVAGLIRNATPVAFPPEGAASMPARAPAGARPRKRRR